MIDDDNKMSAFEESGKKSTSESSSQCKKKISKGPTIFIHQDEVSDLDDVPEDDVLLFVLVLMINGVLKREPQRFASPSFIIGIIIALFCSNRERDERDEKERNSTLSEIAITLSFSTLLFSLWLLFFGTKKRLKSFEKRVPWRRCGS